MYRGPFDPFDPDFGRPLRPPDRRMPRRDERPRREPTSLQPVVRPEDLVAANEENERLRAELKAVSQRYVELQQDLERLRGRQESALNQARSEERQQGVRDLLSVLDALDRAMRSAPDRDSAWFEGIRSLHREVLGVLDRRGVERFATPGEPFDPASQEAVAAVPSEVLPDGSIAAVEAYGYRDRDGTLLRPARVVVVRRG